MHSLSSSNLFSNVRCVRPTLLNLAPAIDATLVIIDRSVPLIAWKTASLAAAHFDFSPLMCLIMHALDRWVLTRRATPRPAPSWSSSCQTDEYTDLNQHK